MAEITVTETGSGDGTVCEVVVTDGRSKTTHRVTVPEDLYQRLTSGNISKAQCVEAAFHFLLDRESKESILRSFDLPLISNYFPEFEREFQGYVRA